jgi:hypothetical protein
MGGPKVYYKETEEEKQKRKELIQKGTKNYSNEISYKNAVESGMYTPSVYGDDNYSVDSIGHRLHPFNVENLLKSFSDIQKGMSMIYLEMHDKFKQCKNENNSKIYSDFYEFYTIFNELSEKCKYYCWQNDELFRCYDETQNAPAQDDPRWLIMRSDGIGASEADNLRKNESNTLRKWIKEKAGVIPRSFTGNEYTEFGHQMEPVVGKILDHKYNTKLFESTSLVHKKYPFLRASLDRYGYIYGMPHIIEIKSPATRIPEKDSIPLEYDAQMYQQHEVSQIQNGIFADFKFHQVDTYKLLINAIEKDTFTKPSRKKYYGAVIKFPCSKRAYAYSPISEPEKCYEWVKRMEKKIIAKGFVLDESTKKWNASEQYDGIAKVVFWRLTHMVLVPHRYNPKWCEENLEKYTIMWERIQSYKNGYKDEDDIRAQEDANLFD